MHWYELSERYNVTGIFKAKEAEFMYRGSYIFPATGWDYSSGLVWFVGTDC